MKIKVNGIEMHYLVEGEGPWLVMSHSLACDSRMWTREATALAGRFRVLRIDTRGHGGSEAPVGDYSLDLLAGDVKALLGALDITEPHWVGLSMGGIIGQAVEIEFPGTFKSMVLADTTSRFPASSGEMWAGRVKTVREKGMAAIVDSTLERWFTAPFRKEGPATIAEVSRWISETDPNGYCGCCAMFPTLDTTPRLGEIKSPTLIVCGDQDTGTPLAMARILQQGIRGAELAAIANAGHLSNIEQPVTFISALERFYERIQV